MRTMEQLAATTPDATDLRILATARREFSTNGFHGANMDVIALEAGVGKGTVYRRFHNKEQLFFSLLEWTFNEFIQFLETPERPGTFRERVERHMRRARRFVKENLDLIRLLAHERSRISEACGSDELLDWARHFHRTMYRFWIRISREAAAAGELGTGEDPELVGTVLGCMAHAVYGDMILSEGAFTDRDFRRREDVFLRIIEDGLFVQGGHDA